MTRARKPVGRIAFVGAGPGDPGLLTMRAAHALDAASLVVTDPDVPADITALAGEAEVKPAVGEPAEVAKALVAAAKNGQFVVRLVAGDVLTADPVVKELQSVSRSAVLFDVIPGLSATAVASYSGIAVGSVHTVADVRSTSDWPRLAAAPGTLLLQASSGHLADTAALLAQSGMAGETPASVTSGATLPTQRTVDGTLATLDGIGGDMTGPLVVTVGAGITQRNRLSWWESRALYGWRVLIPQTKDPAEEMLELLRLHGAIPQRVPTVAVEPPRTPAQMERAVKGLVDGRYQWIVFTSINSVRAVWEKFVEFGLDARAFSGVRIACVDSATGDAVRALGIVPELISADQQSSAGLLSTFPEYDDILDPVDRVLLPRADIATETLAEGLRERGWEIDDVTAYRTVRAAPPAAPIREAIKTGGFDAVCFTSSSTVRNLVGIAG
ncbi:MAG TPA: uroporphyrinogen-III synthase, partial [Nakamurella multipartita]|nr:uroporphyrinogen-III synthase [Nakamurella multipartita]